MAEEESNRLVRQHLRSFFKGHDCAEHIWKPGPAYLELPRLRVAEFAPGPRTDLWVYATLGTWEAREDARLEFLIAAQDQDQRQVELLCMAAWYHKHHCLGYGHSLPIGEPWLPGSKCDFLLVSLPYPFGPNLEVCDLPDGHVHVLWLLPITAAEREFKVREGLDALEQRFENSELKYWDPNRASII